MSNNAKEFLKLGGSNFFAIFDLSRLYWHFDLHNNSHILQSFITADFFFQPEFCTAPATIELTSSPASSDFYNKALNAAVLLGRRHAAPQ